MTCSNTKHDEKNTKDEDNMVNEIRISEILKKDFLKRIAH